MTLEAYSALRQKERSRGRARTDSAALRSALHPNPCVDAPASAANTSNPKRAYPASPPFALKTENRGSNIAGCDQAFFRIGARTDRRGRVAPALAVGCSASVGCCGNRLACGGIHGETGPD